MNDKNSSHMQDKIQNENDSKTQIHIMANLKT